MKGSTFLGISFLLLCLGCAGSDTAQDQVESTAGYSVMREEGQAVVVFECAGCGMLLKDGEANQKNEKAFCAECMEKAEIKEQEIPDDTSSTPEEATPESDDASIENSLQELPEG